MIENRIVRKECEIGLIVFSDSGLVQWNFCFVEFMLVDQVKIRNAPEFWENSEGKNKSSELELELGGGCFYCYLY